MNKYDWSKVPNHYKYMATDMDGFARAHRSKPIAMDYFNSWIMGGDYTVIHWPSKNPFNGDWRESLEERP